MEKSHKLILTMRLNRQKFEKGAALIVLLFIIGLSVTSYLLQAVNALALQRERAQQTIQSLGAAKQALLAWAVNNSVNLGQLPFPDRAQGGGYDGFSDCSPSGTPFNDPASYRLLIGKLPVYGQTSPCVGQQVGLGLDNNDHLENRLWYAVSRNVVHQYEYLSTDPRSDPVINPSIIHHPNYPWLKVLDRNGQLIADRVAAVIIAPGENLGSQNRAEGARPHQFLDSLTKEGVLYANSDYDQADEDFVMGGSTESIDALDTTVGRPYLFNDQLVYITADELITAINKRVIAETKWLLNAYEDSNGFFPNAADLQTTTIQSNRYIAGVSQTGFVPFDVTDSCQCSSAERCFCRFGAVASVTLVRNSGTWRSAEDMGACRSTLKASGQECTCTGAGSCSRTFSTQSTRFICDATGLCTTQNLTLDQHKYIYTLPKHADVDQASNHCKIVRQTIECNAEGHFQIGLRQASWLKQNGWQQYLYYAWSPTRQLQAGTRKHIAALLIAVGEPINTELAVHQARPSDSIVDYLDSAEHTDGDTTYESVLKKKSNHYNDAIFIVSP
jgi:hypothetical protein